jgi:hypothetical protein
MLSVNSSLNVQQQNTPTFGGNKKIISKYGKTFWEREVLRTHNDKNPHAYFSSPLHLIKNWFKELKLRISGTTTKKLREIYTPQYNNNDIYTKAWMESLETMAKKFLKK